MFVSGDTPTNYNSYSIFDVSGISGDAAQATLRLEIESYTGSDASETVTVYDVSPDAATLEAGGTGSVGVFQDLQRGNVYATFTVTAADVGSVMEISLSGEAVTDLNAAGEHFSVGVHLSMTDGNTASQWVRFSAASEARVHQLVARVEADCNDNGIPDHRDIAGGNSADCNLNGVPDECDMANGSIGDCNGHGIPDDCDTSTTISYDVLFDGLLNVPLGCGSGPYTCGGQSRFTWTNAGVGIVTEVQIAFNVGVECHTDGTPMNTSVNGVADASYASARRDCSCAPTEAVVGSINANPLSYKPGRANTFLITNTTACLGFVPDGSWGGGVYARITVRYSDPALDGNGVPDEREVLHFVDVGAVGGNDGSSWADAYTDLRDALSACQPGNQAWVAQGVYSPGFTFVLRHACRTYGGFAGTESQLEERSPEKLITVLSSDNNGDNPNIADNALHVLTVLSSTIGLATVLDGFTVRAGYADGLGSFDSSGGRMIIFSETPTLSRLIFEGNHADQLGGAMYISNADGLRIERSRVLNNDAPNAGAVYMTGADPVLTNCLFHDNVATGASPGGAGGALLNVVSNPMLINCTIADNTAGNKGGGIFNDFISGGSSPTLVNCILWNNLDAGGVDLHRLAGSCWGDRKHRRGSQLRYGLPTPAAYRCY